MIDVDLSRNSEDRRATAAAFLHGVLDELIRSGGRSCTARVVFLGGGKPQKFRITYVGPSRRRTASPSMTAGKRSK